MMISRAIAVDKKSLNHLLLGSDDLRWVLELVMNERRTSTRRKELLQARIFFNNRQSGFNCIVRDFSAKGARISIADRDRVPDEFELYIPVKQKAFPSRVQWRRNGEIGLVFVQSLAPDAAAAATSLGDLRKRMEQMQSEISDLHRQVNELTIEVRRERV